MRRGPGFHAISCFADGELSIDAEYSAGGYTSDRAERDQPGVPEENLAAEPRRRREDSNCGSGYAGGRSSLGGGGTGATAWGGATVEGFRGAVPAARSPRSSGGRILGAKNTFRNHQTFDTGASTGARLVGISVF